MQELSCLLANPLQEAGRANWQEDGLEAGNRQEFDRCRWGHLLLSQHGIQSEVTFDPRCKIMQRRFPFYSAID